MKQEAHWLQTMGSSHETGEGKSMGRTVAIGIQSFEEIIKENYCNYYYKCVETIGNNQQEMEAATLGPGTPF